MSDSSKPIPPNPPRWNPKPDPANIIIPGLETEASTTDQIEQIEQLITIKLQNIDENFSKIHNVLANKLLPSVKRYAVGTEPVREAAKFWTSFYEQAAQIRIPTYDDDYSTVNEVPSERDDTGQSSQDRIPADGCPGDRTERPQEAFETTVNSETSFLPGHGAFSSTPATTARIVSSQQSFASQGSEGPSWSQSPLAKLSHELNAFSSELHTLNTAEHDSIEHESSVDSTFQQDSMATVPPSAKGKGKDTAHPLLKNVLRHNLYSVTDNSSFEGNLKPTSPLKFRGKNKTPVIDRNLNPYLPPGSSSTNWSGLVDLRESSALTSQRHRAGNISTNEGEADEDSFDGLPPGMSPLVLMSPVRPPRSSAELGLLKLTQTPTREASQRIQRNLIASALKTVHKSGIKGQQLRKEQVVDSSMSTVPTPPSLSRYAHMGGYSAISSSISKDSSLESMIRHIKGDIQSSASTSARYTTGVGGTGSTPGLRLRPKEMQPSTVATLSQPGAPTSPMYEFHQSHNDSLDSDSDSLDSINNTAHPSAAFLMASGGARYLDEDSFGSSNHSSDSLENEDPNALGEGIVPVHPFAVNAAVVDDGFDDDDSSDDFEVGHLNPVGSVAPVNYLDEDTVFGMAPGQRESAAYGRQHLQMLGEDLLQDTIGIGAQLAASGRVEESPTPATWGSNGYRLFVTRSACMESTESKNKKKEECNGSPDRMPSKTRNLWFTRIVQDGNEGTSRQSQKCSYAPRKGILSLSGPKPGQSAREDASDDDHIRYNTGPMPSPFWGKNTLTPASCRNCTPNLLASP